jgi:hypothetical protein
MSKKFPIFNQCVIAALILALGFAALPIESTMAAEHQDDSNPPVNQPSVEGNPDPRYQNNNRDGERLEQAWARMKTTYLRQGDRLSRAGEFITRAHSLIEKANQKGWDTSTVQAALGAFAAVIPAAQFAHNHGTAIIASHEGFDTDGKVTDRITAVETVKSLGLVIKNTRLAMNGTGQTLRQAVRTFRDSHRPPQPPTVP